MTLPTPYLPTPEFVAQAAVQALLPVGVATTLPKAGTWTTIEGVQGFATVTVVGGSAGYTPLRHTVVSVDGWATIPGSDRPPWGFASQLVERVVDASRRDFDPVQVRQSDAYTPAVVHSLWFVSEPRRVPDPDASVAHFSVDVGLSWSPTL